VFLLTGGTCEIEIEVEVEADTGTVYCGCFILCLLTVNVNVVFGTRWYDSFIAAASTDNDTLRPLDRCAGCL
jgi:hypothetical protein